MNERKNNHYEVSIYKNDKREKESILMTDACKVTTTTTEHNLNR